MRAARVHEMSASLTFAASARSAFAWRVPAQPDDASARSTSTAAFCTVRSYGDTAPMPDTNERLRGLVEAGIALTSELSLENLLQKLAGVAAELTGARYAALGVIDPSGTHLERFVTHGLTDEEHRAIGELPRGRGVLGALIHDAAPLRLTRIADDERSVGFPPNHP